MNKAVNKFLLAGHRFMPKIHFRTQTTFSASRPLAKNREKIQKFKETGDSQYSYQNKTNKACLQHDMVYRDSKDLARITASDKVLSDKALSIAKKKPKI